MNLAQFSFYLGNSARDFGELTLGGSDPSKYTGAVSWVPLKAATYWEIELGSLTVNGVAYGANNKFVL